MSLISVIWQFYVNEQLQLENWNLAWRWILLIQTWCVPNFSTLLSIATQVPIYDNTFCWFFALLNPKSWKYTCKAQNSYNYSFWKYKHFYTRRNLRSWVIVDILIQIQTHSKNSYLISAYLLIASFENPIFYFIFCIFETKILKLESLKCNQLFVLKYKNCGTKMRLSMIFSIK